MLKTLLIGPFYIEILTRTLRGRSHCLCFVYEEAEALRVAITCTLIPGARTRTYACGRSTPVEDSVPSIVLGALSAQRGFSIFQMMSAKK